MHNTVVSTLFQSKISLLVVAVEMSEAQRPRQHHNWSTPLHAGEREAASTGGAGLLTLEDAGNYRATCRRCRDEVPLRQCRQPPPAVIPYVLEFRQQRFLPDNHHSWFQTEPGCWFRVSELSLLQALNANDIPAAVFLCQVDGMVFYYHRVQTVEMVQALHEAGVDFALYLMNMVDSAPLPVVEAALGLQVDINTADAYGRSLLHVAIGTADIDRVRVILARNPDTTKMVDDRTALQLAQLYLRNAQAYLQDHQIDNDALQRVARYTEIVALLQ